MDIVEEMLEGAIAELEEMGFPELAAEIRPILAKVEAQEPKSGEVEEEAEEASDEE